MPAAMPYHISLYKALRRLAGIQHESDSIIQSQMPTIAFSRQCRVFLVGKGPRISPLECLRLVGRKIMVLVKPVWIEFWTGHADSITCKNRCVNQFLRVLGAFELNRLVSDWQVVYVLTKGVSLESVVYALTAFLSYINTILFRQSINKICTKRYYYINI